MPQVVSPADLPFMCPSGRHNMPHTKLTRKVPSVPNLGHQRIYRGVFQDDIPADIATIAAAELGKSQRPPRQLSSDGVKKGPRGKDMRSRPAHCRLQFMSATALKSGPAVDIFSQMEAKPKLARGPEEKTLTLPHLVYLFYLFLQD